MIDPLRASDPVLFSKGDESGGKSESEADRQLGEVEGAHGARLKMRWRPFSHFAQYLI